ncbi:RND family efflux transporter, MFP subunit [Pedobacter westerhofensis]|uniref:RND family efflux transporter, MFP subunit n=1 Tax=Pedobacter westerhofensis TaxID=425512 RepID=A0A521BPC7_9SPHI|nr:efflux RND transporter periplasmic adaptor subunit [Pedobacter westerhofensis]SMO48959.1 RND family efflux transporter, MFP subunit [Pedobacter westerhofensis]
MKVKYIVIACILVLSAACSSPKPKEKEVEASKPHYRVTSVQRAGMEQTVKLPAQLAAYQEVSVFPKVNGYVKSVLVDIGSKVTKGQLLMTLEAPEILQSALQAKEKYARSQSDFNLNRENYERLRIASRTPGAISPMELATYKSKMQSDSALSNAEKASWQMQKVLMGYLRVTAPFSGVITDRNTHPGDLASAGSKDSKPMLELKQVDHLRLQVEVPEGLAAALKTGDKISFYLSALPGKKMTATISRKAGNVNIQYRSERVELDVDNRNGKLSPGMYADVIMKVKGSPEDLVVPKAAVVTSTERKYVIAIRGGETMKVDVSTGIEFQNKVTVAGDLKNGDQVIAEANDEIEEGLKLN